MSILPSASVKFGARHHDDFLERSTCEPTNLAVSAGKLQGCRQMRLEYIATSTPRILQHLLDTDVYAHFHNVSVSIDLPNNNLCMTRHPQEDFLGKRAGSTGRIARCPSLYPEIPSFAALV
eukprot:449703-Pyramimonas_sp.AAC.1